MPAVRQGGAVDETTLACVLDDPTRLGMLGAAVRRTAHADTPR